ncbi:hypothetical protein N752_29955 [Desulforamulus aquiferis]|nr:hypothetical protein N752_29955 [Desulforamulus aquiferis]
MQHIADEADHIYLALGATDFRKQQNGLASLVALKFKLDPHEEQAYSCSVINVIMLCGLYVGTVTALFWLPNHFPTR